MSSSAVSTSTVHSDDEEYQVSMKKVVRLNKRWMGKNGKSNEVEQSEAAPKDAWSELGEQVKFAKEIVEGKHKKKLEKQDRLIKEYDQRIQIAEAQGEQYVHLYNKAKSQNAMLLKKIEELENNLHAVTSGDSVDHAAL